MKLKIESCMNFYINICIFWKNRKLINQYNPEISATYKPIIITHRRVAFEL